MVAVAMLALAFAADARAVPLVPLAPKRVAYCERSALLRAACPRRVPRVRAAYLSHLSFHPARRGPRVDIFNLERGGEYPAEPERNRPPRMAHLVIVAGEVEHSAPVFGWGGARRYVVSLHAWEPLTEAAATLKAIVASTPAASRRR